LRPGGKLVLTDWCQDYPTMGMLDGYLRIFNNAHGRVHRVKGLEHLLRSNGFGDIRSERYKINWFWGLVTVEAVALC
jgi:hypothetical protein